MKIISIHSFRGGTGKSNITANLGYCLAAMGAKVCIIDTDIQSPGMHILLKLANYRGPSLNDYLFNRREIEEVVVDVSEYHNLKKGTLNTIVCNTDTESIAEILKKGYDITNLAKAFRILKEKLGIEYLLIDTHPGLNEETLLAAGLSDLLIVVMRPDEQDYQGTAVTIDVAKKLGVKNIGILMNMISPDFNHEQVKKEVLKKYSCEVLETLPHTYTLNKIASKDLYCSVSPKDVWPQKILQVSKNLESL
jgi:MinD-like ATPase involved in chromosome partitioning or flagellar assembly